MDSLIARLEAGDVGEEASLLREAFNFALAERWISAEAYDRALRFIEVGASVDAALTLVPKGCYWRVNSYAEALVFDAYERACDGSALPGPGDVARALTAAALLARATTTHPQETGDGE